MKRVLIILSIFFLVTSLASAKYYDLIENFSVSKFIETDYARIVLSWELLAEAKDLANRYPNSVSIALLRGTDLVGIYEGTTETLEVNELSYGAIQYTVVWLWGIIICDYETGILNLGRIKYTHPGGSLDGFYVYLADSPSKFDSLIDHSFEVPDTILEIPLINLLDAEKIEPNKLYYLVMASFRKEGDFIITSEFTETVLNFTYLNKTWEIPKVPGIPQKPELQW